MYFNTKLHLLPILDITHYTNPNISFNTEIIKTTHKFSLNSAESGNNSNEPIFGSNFWVGNGQGLGSGSIEQSGFSDFGFPILKVRRDQFFYINQKNLSTYAVNIHFHGVNFNPYNDGASSACMFGPDTAIGLTNSSFYQMRNNSSVCWYHPHNMYSASEYVYLGMVGLVQITDKQSELVDNFFITNDNYLPLIAIDMDINSDGTINKDNLYSFNWRGTNCAINGINCVDWNDIHDIHDIHDMHDMHDMHVMHAMNNSSNTFIDKLYHETSNNILKITLLNGNCSFRTYYLGICDKNEIKKKFFLIQTDTGYRNPIETDIIYFAPGSRIGLMVDLADFEDGEAYVFFYSFDLTLNNGLQYLDQLVNPVQQGDQTVYIPYPCGVEPIPTDYIKKRFLKIIWTREQKNNIDLIKTLIQEIVFGINYPIVNKIQPLELESVYWKYLNPDYYYNLPNFSQDIPIRKFAFLVETSSVQSFNQTTEFFNGVNRIYVDMWNSYEYDMWIRSYCSKYLPTCLFKISKYRDGYLKYENYQMSDGHLLYVNIYEPNEKKLIEQVKIIFDEREDPYNIDEWIKLVNYHFKNTKLKNFACSKIYKLSDLIEYNWAPYKYQSQFLQNPQGQYYDQTVFINTVQMINSNKSPFIIEFKAKFPLLQYFGKPFGVMGMDMDMGMGMGMMNMDMKSNITHKSDHSKQTHMCVCGPDCKCGPNCQCEKISIHEFNQIDHESHESHESHENMSMGLQELYVYAGSVNGDMKSSDSQGYFSLEIKPNSKYYGFIDGILNDSLMNFSVTQESTERWVYYNLDSSVSHPFHLHMTSGYIVKEDPNISECMLESKFNGLNYSKDNYTIPPQQIISFYLKFPNTNSNQGKIKYLGYMYHCHFMAHHDMSMMGQYYVRQKSWF